MISAREARDLSDATRARLERAQLEHLLARVETAVRSAAARGDLRCEVPFEDFNVHHVHEALKGLGTYDAGGLVGNINPGAKTPAQCFMVAKVEGGQWVREFPDSGFQC